MSGALMNNNNDTHRSHHSSSSKKEKGKGKEKEKEKEKAKAKAVHFTPSVSDREREKQQHHHQRHHHHYNQFVNHSNNDNNNKQRANHPVVNEKDKSKDGKTKHKIERLMCQWCLEGAQEWFEDGMRLCGECYRVRAMARARGEMR